MLFRSMDVLSAIAAGADLRLLEPKKYTDLIGGRTAADIGCEPILHMRHFQRSGRIPEELVDAVLDEPASPVLPRKTTQGKALSSLHG